ncbi:DUF58 domain-containing protein [uncultured Friedmanniella sp.]|uniref:DUF58 domain-containing protein n=1 Tax=uncultured Friedmanniella sp. TaxID=335381 RepID=UPI0035CC2D86
MKPFPRWQVAPAAVAWLVGGIGVLLFGVLVQRPDVAVLGLPLLLGVVVSWTRWPGDRPGAELHGVDQAATSGRLAAELQLQSQPGELVAVRVGAPGHRSTDCLLAGGDRTLTVEMSSVRTGRRPLFRLDAGASDAAALLVTPITADEPIEMTVLPASRALRALPLPFRLQGLTGPHDSRRAGDGGDLHDVAPFRPGDRLRRIDWRVTARLNRGQPGAGAGAVTQLYVRRTFATADATVMLVVDSRDDVGPRVSTWGDAAEVDEDEPTSLDLARFAAASVARAYLEAGDRVGLEDLGRLRRPSPPAGGRSQLQRLVQQLAVTAPEGEPTRRRRVPRLPSGSLIVLFSTFLDDDAADLAGSWRQTGHRVVAVDILPPVVTSDLTSRLDTAYRIVAMERADRIEALSRLGVETVAWQLLVADRRTGGTDPATALDVLARRRHRR